MFSHNMTQPSVVRLCFRDAGCFYGNEKLNYPAEMDSFISTSVLFLRG
jgi:hypothetical protein